MFETPLNEKDITVNMKRSDLCDLITACTVLHTASVLGPGTDEETTKWAKLNDKLNKILTDLDSKKEF